MCIYLWGRGPFSVDHRWEERDKPWSLETRPISAVWMEACWSWWLSTRLEAEVRLTAQRQRDVWQKNKVDSASHHRLTDQAWKDNSAHKPQSLGIPQLYYFNSGGHFPYIVASAWFISAGERQLSHISSAKGHGIKRTILSCTFVVHSPGCYWNNCSKYLPAPAFTFSTPKKLSSKKQICPCSTYVRPFGGSLDPESLIQCFQRALAQHFTPQPCFS